MVGLKSAEDMVQSAQSTNATMTWVLRAVGLGLMTIGLICVFGPLAVIADVIPFLGDLVGIGTSLIAFMIALPLSLITIAVAWIVYRPVLGIGLLVGAGLVIGAIFMLKSRGSKG